MSIKKGYFSETTNKKTGYNYYIYTPENYEKTQKKWPLLLFLHGMGERGNNLRLVKKNGPLKRLDDGVTFPFIIVAPQCPEGSWWDADNLKNLLDHIIKDYKIDTDRIYLTGVSMGGSGTWDLANNYPEYFAAIAPVCPFFTPGDPGRFKNLPIWCFHGEKDDVVPIDDSKRMIEWIQENGGTVRFTSYPDLAHNCWRETYSNPELYEWLLKHKKSR